MNSKELLERANAKATQLKELADTIRRIDDILPDIRDKALYINSFDIGLRFGGEISEKLSQNILLTLITAKNDKTAELEQMLGIQQVPVTTITKKFIPTGEQHVEVIPAPVQGKCKPAIINPEFEAVPKSELDPIEEKLSEILQREEDRISGAADKSLDKYPAKKGKKSTYPDNMTEELIRKMYVEQGMTQKDIANYFGVKRTKVNTFLQKYKLFRGSYNKKDKPAEPEETERP